MSVVSSSYKDIIAEAENSFLRGKSGTFAVVRTPDGKLWYAAPGVQTAVNLLRLRICERTFDERSFAGILIIRANRKKGQYWFVFYNPDDKNASYNASSSNKSDKIRYYNPSSRKYEVRHGGAKLEGSLDGLTATDIRNFARFVAENPGSENQYTYGITEDGQLFSVQNSAQRVTKDYNNSAAMMQALWGSIGYDTTPNYDSYDQNSDLDQW